MAGQDYFGKTISPSESSVTPSISTTAYSSGQLIGSKLTFTTLVGPNGQGVVDRLLIIDKAQQELDGILILFHQDPSNSTFTDQSSFSVADADLDKIVGVVEIQGPSDYVNDGNTSYATYDIDVPVDGDDSRIYAALVSKGTPNFGNADDLIVKLQGTY